MGNEKRRAVFFDRDGTLNVEKHFLYKIEDFEWQEDAPGAIRYANGLGLPVVVVSNQSGVARGYFTEADVRRLHEWMNEDLSRYGARIDAFYYCPHLPGAPVREYDMECSCRKPKPGLIERAAAELGIDLPASILIGDAERDVECARAAGVRGILYSGGSLVDILKKEL